MRPDPDTLLARISDASGHAARGRLTIFLGSAPGVGKTYAMLEAARFEREAGRDVVVGLVETHGRYDTGALLLGLELLRRRKIQHRGIELEELDIDAVLARRPALVLVDELAHTNAPGSRHTKRWQDVEEILAAGIDVYTTLNVQHVASLVDVVAQITHVTVRETVPDSVLDDADDVRLIDLPIDELLQRLREGKVYVAEEAARARESFFREGNLIALRELALRSTAQRVDAQMRRYRALHGIERTWAAGERVLVCVSPSPAAGHVVRGARRLAGNLHAEWIAAYVEGPAQRLSGADRQRVNEHLRLAQSLGAETVTLGGERSADVVVRFARSRNVTRIVVGRPTHARWRDRLRPSFLDELVRSAGAIEVHVLGGERAPVDGAPTPAAKASLPLAGLGAAVGAVALTTGIAKLLFGADQLADVVMLLLLGIVLVSLRWGLASSLVATVLAVVALDFFFVPPVHTFSVGDVNHIATFAVMFVVALVISGLTKRVRDQAIAAREREVRTASLYALSGGLSRAKTTADVATVATKNVQRVFGGKACVLVADDSTNEPRLEAVGAAPGTLTVDDKERSVAVWVLQNGKSAGAGTDTLPASTATWLPLEAGGRRIGVLGVAPADGRADLGFDPGRQHLAAFAQQIADALRRTRLAEDAQKAQLRIEAEQLRNSLLSSVSHDLRTPLAVITGAASTLRDAELEAPVRRELLETVVVEAERLHRLVRNLLDMTRLEAGAVEVKKEWQPLEEAIGVALGRVERIVGARPIVTDVPADLPLVPFDAILLEQVLVNLLENAVKYAPGTSAIEVRARALEDAVEVTVSDRGPGLPPGEEGKIFDKFYRAEKGRGGGVGLGLTICRGIVVAHGGRIWAVGREGGGAAFHFTLPIEGTPPTLEALEPARAEQPEPPRERA